MLLCVMVGFTLTFFDIGVMVVDRTYICKIIHVTVEGTLTIFEMGVMDIGVLTLKNLIVVA